MRPTLVVADLGGDTVTRLSRHPYRRDGRRFAWGRSTSTDHPGEPLPAIIADLVARWREPARNPRSPLDCELELRRGGYDVATNGKGLT